MTFGVRVTLTEKDKATLGALAARAPHLVDAKWEERSGPGFVGIFSEALDADLARDLRVRGIDVVKHVPASAGRVDGVHGGDPSHVGTTLATAPRPPEVGTAFGSAPRPPEAGTATEPARVPREAVPVVDGVVSVRAARGLIEAVRPVSEPDAVPAEALFFAKIDGGGAQRTLERLLLLDRDDAQVGEVETSAGRVFVVRVATPPLYLLYRAREEVGEGVRVYARRSTSSRVYCAWGTTHPLLGLLEDRLASANRTALVDADGTITFASATWDLRPLLDAVRPDLIARHDVVAPVPGSLSFPVRLRLGPSDVADPELWLLTPEQLFKLESFVDASPAEEVGRLLVSRVAGDDGRARYVVREAVRPQLTRLGPRVASLVESVGYARAPAFDNLYLPPSKRLVPQLARDQLKALLGLDQSAAVVVDEDGDGLFVVHVKTLDDAPLSRFTTWIATDRRQELDRLYEEAVLSFPGVAIEKPEKKEPSPIDLDEKEPRAPRGPRDRPAPRPAQLTKETALDGDAGKDVAALRAEVRALEEKVLSSHSSDPSSWRELGLLKSALDEADDACACLEVALFLGAPTSGVGPASGSAGAGGGLGKPPEQWASETALELGKQRRGLLPKEPEPQIIDLALHDRLSREEAGLLGARVVHALAKGESLLEDLLQHTTQLFLKDDVLVSRRLQWAVLHAINARAQDGLGATRAKEAVLGSLNARGLSETLDLPRFVRTALALMPGDDQNAPSDRSRHEQLVQLEKLFSRAVPHATKLTDARDAFLRAIFAVGLGRLGGNAPEIIRSLQAELDAHDAPNRALLRLYIARLSHFLTKGNTDAWKKEVDAVTSSLPRPEDKRVVDWLVKRSLWLRPTPPEEQPHGLRPALERHLAAAERNADDLASATNKVHEMNGLYDYEVATAIERMLRAALGSGRDEIIRATLLAALKGVARIKILAHRVRALGSCVRAAATLEDGELVDQCLDGIAAAARSPNVPSVRDLLVAVKPALSALRRLGAAEAAQRFLSSLEPVATSNDRGESGPLLAALSDGFLQLGDVDKAKSLVNLALQRALANPSHVDRYEAGAAILEALAHWDLETRAQQCGAILAELARFTDTFTTSRFFSTHQILIAERLVETVVDDVTLRSDRLQAYLDGEEQVIRRRILQQWSALCR